jgi:DHA1 family tetracycline resistance protein-like MFS transporter
VILGSLLGSGLDLFLMAFAPTLPWFFLGRIVSGIMGASFSAATAYIADITPPERRAANFGLIGMAFGIGFIVGPALGGVLGHYGLRVPFLVAGGLALLNWLYGFFVLPESLAVPNRRPFSWARSNPVGSLAALGRYPMVLGLTATYFLFYLAHQVYPSIWVLYSGYRYGWDTRATGLSLAAVGLAAAVVQGKLTGPIVKALGERTTVLAGLAIVAVGYICYGLAWEGWMVYVIIAFGALGGVTSPAVQSIISQSVGADEQGGVQGSLTSLASVAGILGPLLATNLFGYFIGPRAPVVVPGAAFFASSALTVVAMAMALRAFARAPRPDRPAPALSANIPDTRQTE